MLNDPVIHDMEPLYLAKRVRGIEFKEKWDIEMRAM